MAQKPSSGNDALALVGNTLPTGAILIVLILIFGPISGAHFNLEGRAPQDPKVKVRRVTRGARRQRTLASNSAVGRMQFLPLGGSNPLAPASQSGLCGVISRCGRTAAVARPLSSSGNLAKSTAICRATSIVVMRRQGHIRRGPRLAAQAFTNVVVFLMTSLHSRPRRGRRQHRARPTLPAQLTRWHSRWLLLPPTLVSRRGYPRVSHLGHALRGQRPPSRRSYRQRFSLVPRSSF